MTSLASSSHADIVSRLSRKIGEVLQPLLVRGTKCALLDFPNHSNVGDSEIWLGERVFLRSMGASVVYTSSVAYPSDVAIFSEAELARRLRGGTILLTGGGNVGDLWSFHQQFRERVIAAFPHNKIIQLPQSIYFRDRANLERARRIFNSHPDLTILVRDQPSLELARNEFRADSILCPDMAFALGTVPRPARPMSDIVWLARTDSEATGSVPIHAQDIEQTDWLTETPSLLWRMNQFLTRQVLRHPSAGRHLAALLFRTYDPLAKERVLRGCAILGRGRVVITDRLHGCLLSLQMGIPHVVLDTKYGKVKSFYETWLKGCELTHWAESREGAIEKARALSRVYQEDRRHEESNISASVADLTTGKSFEKHAVGK